MAKLKLNFDAVAPIAGVISYEEVIKGSNFEDKKDDGIEKLFRALYDATLALHLQTAFYKSAKQGRLSDLKTLVENVEYRVDEIQKALELASQGRKTKTPSIKYLTSLLADTKAGTPSLDA